MPKILLNVKDALLAEAKKQIAENGYAKTTVRSVAKACGLGIGTVYNYFKSKDMLIASFMLNDWLICLDRIKKTDNTSPKAVLFSIYSALIDYISIYSTLFNDSDAFKVFSTAFNQRHKQLRAQLAEIICPICKESSVQDKAFLAEYIAESVLTWTVSGKDFESQYLILKKLL